MRNSMSFPVKKQQVMDHLSKIVDRDAVRSPPRSVLKNEPRDESVESKWEHLQYYEQRWNNENGADPKMAAGSSSTAAAGDSSYSSLAPSEASSSQSRSSSCGEMEGSSKSRSTRAKFQRIKRQSWQRFKSTFSSKSHNQGHPPSSVSYGDFTSAVSSDPAADPAAGGSRNPEPTSTSGSKSGGMMSKIRSSKSMQNLEALTADSYYNLRDVTSNLKEKYHSRVELNRGKPKAEYNELWDEESDMDEDEIRLRTLEMVGLF